METRRDCPGTGPSLASPARMLFSSRLLSPLVVLPVMASATFFTAGCERKEPVADSETEAAGRGKRASVDAVAALDAAKAGPKFGGADLPKKPRSNSRRRMTGCAKSSRAATARRRSRRTRSQREEIERQVVAIRGLEFQDAGRLPGAQPQGDQGRRSPASWPRFFPSRNFADMTDGAGGGRAAADGLSAAREIHRPPRRAGRRVLRPARAQALHV